MRNTGRPSAPCSEASAGLDRPPTHSTTCPVRTCPIGGGLRPSRSACSRRRRMTSRDRSREVAPWGRTRDSDDRRVRKESARSQKLRGVPSHDRAGTRLGPDPGPRAWGPRRRNPRGLRAATGTTKLAGAAHRTGRPARGLLGPPGSLRGTLRSGRGHGAHRGRRQRPGGPAEFALLVQENPRTRSSLPRGTPSHGRRRR